MRTGLEQLCEGVPGRSVHIAEADLHAIFFCLPCRADDAGAGLQRDLARQLTSCPARRRHVTREALCESGAAAAEKRLRGASALLWRGGGAVVRRPTRGVRLAATRGWASSEGCHRLPLGRVWIWIWI